ncbi:ABC transporter ATP-binding protein [Patescibacteria group bacterium]|nr:ABC transporter ATP-binding protein [Patescibacteria group bacterium]
MAKIPKPIIEVKNLIKKYRKAEKNAVDDISFIVQQGEFFAFLGPNGAGKTTTISILTTTLSKTAGQIDIAGFDLDKDSAKVRKNIGIIFQNPSLDLNLTAEENIRLHTILYGLYPFSPSFSLMPQPYKDDVTSLGKVLGIEDVLFQPIKTLSGGMKRKMEIVRSLMHKPKVLFLDEPTSGLDPLSRKNLWDYLMQIKKTENTTIFLTTHYLDEAEHADHVCIINEGKIVALGTPAKIKQNLVEEYLLVDAQNHQKLTAELTQLHIKFAEDDLIRIDLDSKSAQKVISLIKTPLSILRVHTPTLEEAYLEIIENNKERSPNGTV